jgi:hypothetical protein
MRDLQVIQDHFPDGVDIALVDDRYIKEQLCDMVGWLQNKLMDPTQDEPMVKEVYMTLDEIEPETGIYAALSPLTHRVYVYVGPEYLHAR